MAQSPKAATVDHVRTQLALEAQGGENVVKIPQWQLSIQHFLGNGDYGVVHRAQWLGAEVAVRTVDLSDEGTQSRSATKSAQVRLCAQLLLHSAQMCQHCKYGFYVAGDPHARGRVFDNVSASSCDSVVWCGCRRVQHVHSNGHGVSAWSLSEKNNERTQTRSYCTISLWQKALHTPARS